MVYTFRLEGVCASEVRFDVVDGTVRDVQFEDGCDGNLKGISRLVQGMQIDDVITRLSGIRCGASATSCPNELSVCLARVVQESDTTTKDWEARCTKS